MVFRNEVSQINVHFEYGCAVWLTVGRSVNGEQFNLNYLLRLRAPDRERLQAVGNSFDPQQIDEIMRERSDTLREYADDLLRGDFTVFPKLREGQNEQSAEKFRRLEARGLWP